MGVIGCWVISPFFVYMAGVLCTMVSCMHYILYCTTYTCTPTQSVSAENVPWRISEANTDYSMCETYPPILGVPASVNDETLVLASQFRSKGRMPVSVGYPYVCT